MCFARNKFKGVFLQAFAFNLSGFFVMDLCIDNIIRRYYECSMGASFVTLMYQAIGKASLIGVNIHHKQISFHLISGSYMLPLLLYIIGGNMMWLLSAGRKGLISRKLQLFVFLYCSSHSYNWIHVQNTVKSFSRPSLLHILYSQAPKSIWPAESTVKCITFVLLSTSNYNW